MLSGQASVCEGCLKPRKQLPALGRSMGDQGCEQMCLGVTEPIPGAIAQASTPDLGHKKAPCNARGRVMGTIHCACSRQHQMWWLFANGR